MQRQILEECLWALEMVQQCDTISLSHSITHPEDHSDTRSQHTRWYSPHWWHKQIHPSKLYLCSFFSSCKQSQQNITRNVVMLNISCWKLLVTKQIKSFQIAANFCNNIFNSYQSILETFKYFYFPTKQWHFMLLNKFTHV